MVVIPPSVLVDILADAIATGGTLAGAKINLYKNDYTPTPGAVEDDFEVADFTGYDPDTPAMWSAPFIDPALGPVVWTQLIQFQPDTNATVSNTIYGWYLLDAAGNVIGSERLETPRLLATNDNALRVSIGFGIEAG